MLTVDAQILSALRKAGNACVSGADLSQKLGISRAAIWARIEDLRQLGYDIAASPHQGYQLLGIPDLERRCREPIAIVREHAPRDHETIPAGDCGDLAGRGRKQILSRVQRRRSGRAGKACNHDLSAPQRYLVRFHVLSR